MCDWVAQNVNRFSSLCGDGRCIRSYRAGGYRNAENRIRFRFHHQFLDSGRQRRKQAFLALRY